jgi:hypothetical protein
MPFALVFATNMRKFHRQRNNLPFNVLANPIQLINSSETYLVSVAVQSVSYLQGFAA